MSGLRETNPELWRPVQDEVEVAFAFHIHLGMSIGVLKPIMARHEQFILDAVRQQYTIIQTALEIAKLEGMDWPA